MQKYVKMIDLSFFKTVFAENQYFLVECYFDLDSVVIRKGNHNFSSFKECNCKGDGMTGDCDYYQVCKCKDGYYKSGNGCKSMSNNSFLIH